MIVAEYNSKVIILSAWCTGKEDMHKVPVPFNACRQHSIRLPCEDIPSFCYFRRSDITIRSLPGISTRNDNFLLFLSGRKTKPPAELVDLVHVHLNKDAASSISPSV